MKSQKVVIVEDEADIREVIAYNLKREGYRTSAVADGEKALQWVRETLPDLVLLDLMLPGLEASRSVNSSRPILRRGTSESSW